MYRFLLLAFTVAGSLAIIAACNDSDGGRGTGIIAGNPNGGGEPVEVPGLKLEFQALETTIIATSVQTEGSCLNFALTAKNEGGDPVADLAVTVTVVPTSTVVDIGQVTPGEAETDSNGRVTGKYCAGKEEFVGVLVANAGGVSTNSVEFSVQNPSSVKLKFLSSTVAVTEAKEGEEPMILLNLFQSGPNDCTDLTFSITINDEPLVGFEVEFTSQPDFPRGSKLARRNNTGSTVEDSSTGRKSAVYKATSNADGRLGVPVCAGTALGTLLVTGSVADEDGRPVLAHSPIIVIQGGLPSFVNFSLTFDHTNARTLKGYFNTNSPHVIPVEVKVGARQDGDPILDNPVSVVAETGKITMLNGGRINSESGTAKFLMQALHMVNYYAYPIHSFLGYPNARARCNPIEIAQYLTDNASDSMSFRDLSDNWRSTVVYMVRGQEYFYDRNGNGVWDGGQGFWDKNQNGVFDPGIDVMTYDPNEIGEFVYDGEWFIDVSAPFIDVDENMVFNANRDIAISEQGFEEPNGTWDKDTIIWKREVFPIYMGTSPYAMRRHRIQANYNDWDLDLGDWGTDHGYSEDSILFSSKSLGVADFWEGPHGDGTYALSSGVVQSHIYAHGICGNPLPGGTEINIVTEVDAEAAYGPRELTNHIYIQPGDNLLEPARRMLTHSLGGPSAKMNFNAVDHPHSEYGYPVTFSTRVSPCTNACTGELAQGGVACGAKSWQIFVSFHEPEFAGGDVNTVSTFASVPAVQTCVCSPGATFINGDCVAPDDD